MRRFAAAVCLIVLPLTAGARDSALVVANGSYRNAAAIAAAQDALRARPALEAAGFAVLSASDLTGANLRRRLSEFLAGVGEGQRLVVLLTGHFAQSARGTWFLGVDADAPDLATVDGTAIRLDTVLEIVAAAPGGAVVLLGTESRRIALGAGLRAGIGALAVPQGVTVIRGAAADVAAFAERDLTRPGVPMAELLARRSGLTAEGFVSDLVPFLPAAAPPPPPPPPPPVDPLVEERAFYQAARAIGTIEAFEAYIARYPRGAFVAEARAEIERIRTAPLRAAQAAEEALNLTRDQRREIQRHLTLLGFDTRGIDGIFGQGTRAAIARWQESERLFVSGFLDRDQIARLARQAAARAAQLEEEARQRQLEEERRDRAFWTETGSGRTEEGLRRYLERYPDGLFADAARARLAEIEAERRATAAAQDRAAWERAVAGGTEASYRLYLEQFPNGAFVQEARARIAEIREARQQEAALEGARRAEEALALTPFTRTLVEQRLEALGLRPGPVDGTFDTETRRAIRRYQTARGLEATGYLNEATLIRLLADSLR